MLEGEGVSDSTPSVIGAEYAGAESSDDLDGDDLIYVPCRRVHEGDQDAYLELRPLEDGRVAMLAYSSLDHLVAGCGAAQPWLAVPPRYVSECESRSGADVVVWDTELPAELQHISEEE